MEYISSSETAGQYFSKGIQYFKLKDDIKIYFKMRDLISHGMYGLNHIRLKTEYKALQNNIFPIEKGTSYGKVN